MLASYVATSTWLCQSGVWAMREEAPWAASREARTRRAIGGIRLEIYGARQVAQSRRRRKWGNDAGLNKASHHEIRGGRSLVGGIVGANRCPGHMLVPLEKARLHRWRARARGRDSRGHTRARGRLALADPLPALLPRRREPVAAVDGHAAWVRDGTSARSNLDVLTGGPVVLTGLVKPVHRYVTPSRHRGA